MGDLSYFFQLCPRWQAFHKATKENLPFATKLRAKNFDQKTSPQHFRWIFQGIRSVDLIRWGRPESRFEIETFWFLRESFLFRLAFDFQHNSDFFNPILVYFFFFRLLIRFFSIISVNFGANDLLQPVTFIQEITFLLGKKQFCFSSEIFFNFHWTFCA